MTMFCSDIYICTGSATCNHNRGIHVGDEGEAVNTEIDADSCKATEIDPETEVEVVDGVPDTLVEVSTSESDEEFTRERHRRQQLFKLRFSLQNQGQWRDLEDKE